MLTFTTDIYDNFIGYALELISNFCKLEFKQMHLVSNLKYDIYYGNDYNINCRIRIPQVAGYNMEDIPIPITSTGNYSVESVGVNNIFPFDFFSALRFWLADDGNESMPSSAFDQHERLLANHSVQEFLCVREIPVVNIYLSLLRKYLEEILAITIKGYLPEGKRCIIVLSHDVDSPIDPGNVRHLIWQAAMSVKDRKWQHAIYHGKPIISKLMKRMIRKNKDRHWLFREIMNTEEKYNFKSTFFFAPTCRTSLRGTDYDVSYDLRDPLFSDIIREIVERYFEIGLHIGYDAREGFEFIAEEKNNLEKVSGCRIISSRHHLWHMKKPFWPTLDDHARAGLLCDSSVAFNSAPGFRLGVALPFYPWNPLTKQKIPCLQIPPMAMDGGFFYHPGQTVEATLAHFMRLLNRLKQFSGTAAIDWHDYTSFPASEAYSLWGESYLAILDLLAKDREVCVLNCSELLAGYSYKST